MQVSLVEAAVRFAARGIQGELHEQQTDDPRTTQGTEARTVRDPIKAVLSRRGILKLGGGVVAACVVAGALGVRALLAERPHGAKLQVFDDDEAAVLFALAETWFPKDNGLGVSAYDIDVVGSVDAYAARLLPRERQLMRVLMRAVEQWPRLSLQSTARFSALAVDDRQQVMSHFEESAIGERRLLATLLRSLIGMPMFDDPRTLRAIAHRHGCGLPILQPLAQEGA